MLKRFCLFLFERRYPVAIVGLGMLLALPSLWVGMLADDFLMWSTTTKGQLAEGAPYSPWNLYVWLDGDPARTQNLIECGFMAWWTDPHSLAALWRPLSSATYVLGYRLWPHHPWLMHAQSLMWFALLIWCAAVLYRRLIGRTHAQWIAALAALLFTLDDARVLSVGWLADRSTLLSGVFGVVTLIAHDRWRRDGWRAGRFVGPLLLAVGLLAKESVASTGGYLLAYALLLDAAPRRSRLLSLLPYIIVGAVWYGIYITCGYGISISEGYIDPAHNPVGFMYHLARYGPILLLAQWGLPSSDLSIAWSPWAFQIHWLWAIVFLALVAVMLWPLVVRDKLARFWTLGLLLSILPVSVAMPMDRHLMLVGLGGMGLLAQFLGGLKDNAPWAARSAAWRRTARVFAGLMVAIHVVVAPAMFLFMLWALRFVGPALTPLLYTFPDDPQLAHQNLVIVNPKSFLGECYISFVRDYEGRPFPRRCVYLTNSSASASITRTDERTLVVRVRLGYLPPPGEWPDGAHPPAISSQYARQLVDRLFRSEGNPLRLGQIISLSFVDIEIAELTADGRPAVVRFRFRVPLEDPSLRWLRTSHEGYTPFKLPFVGETVEIGPQ